MFPVLNISSAAAGVARLKAPSLSPVTRPVVTQPVCNDPIVHKSKQFVSSIKLCASLNCRWRRSEETLPTHGSEIQPPN